MRVFGNVWRQNPANAAFERGDMFLRTVQAYTPPGGDLSEQFDRATGAQTSAKHLAWSYAAFITAAASRRQAARPFETRSLRDFSSPASRIASRSVVESEGMADQHVGVEAGSA